MKITNSLFGTYTIRRSDKVLLGFSNNINSWIEQSIQKVWSLSTTCRQNQLDPSLIRTSTAPRLAIDKTGQKMSWIQMNRRPLDSG